MAMHCSLASLLLLLFVVVLSVSQHIAVTADTVHNACANTLYPDLCVSTLSANPESKGADVRALTELAISVSADMGADVGTYARARINSVVDSHLWQCLDECADDIEEAVGHLDDSEGDVDDDKFSELRTFLSTALSDSSSCEHSCRDAPDVDLKKSLLSKNLEFEKMMRITLALINEASSASPGATAAATGSAGGSASAPAPAQPSST